jgi:hypothetical protein
MAGTESFGMGNKGGKSDGRTSELAARNFNKCHSFFLAIQEKQHVSMGKLIQHVYSLYNIDTH